MTSLREKVERVDEVKRELIPRGAGGEKGLSLGPRSLHVFGQKLVAGVGEVEG